MSTQRILIVDDNETNLYYLQVLLSAHGYVVISARNGAEAFASALATPPDLVLSDILMPVMDGFTLCRRWRKEPRLAAIPFVFCTATYTDPKDRELGLSLGADEFLTKPLEPDVLVKAVRDVLERSKTAEPSPPQMPSEEIDIHLQEYNRALVRKLEDKLMQLEAANQRLAEAKDFVHAMLNNSPLPVIAADKQGKITLVNPAFCTTFGYQAWEVEGKSCSETIDPPGGDDELSLLQQLSANGGGPISTQRLRKDGTAIDVELFLSPLRVRDEMAGLLAIYRDVTQQRKLEDQLRQAQKLEAVGQLAAGVAHDFNNLLSVIVGSCELIRSGADPQSQTYRHAEQIGRACSRATGLIRHLLAFSRRQVLLPQVMDLAAFMEEIKPTLRRLIRADVELLTYVQPRLGRIMADPGQIEQILLNLTSNAEAAMPNGGRLTIHLSNAKVNETQARGPGSPAPNGYVKLTVSDNGTGMDKATRDRIFEPFFTTKPAGMGTGLGLSSVHGIVEQSGGTIAVSSEPGQGSSFNIYFPRVRSQAPAALPLSETPVSRGSETILVADDEDALRDLTCESLSRLGYHVLSANSANDAVRIIRDAKEQIDLLITDVVMPEMNGLELSEVAWTSRPQMPVLYVSGYETTLVHEQRVSRGRVNFLMKPFTYNQLAAEVRKALS
jgi:PAS domain S-box-containing protein